jgi:hypothetical protein
MVIICKDVLKQKNSTFLQENQITALDKDPTDYFQKHIQQIIHKYNIINDKNQYKHLLQIKPTTSKLNAVMKIQKDNNPIGLEINNIQAPAYELARYLNKRLNELIEVPYMCATKNLKEVAQDLTNIQINNQHTMTTLDIKDLYINLPIQDIHNVTKFGLNKNMKP